MMHLGQIIARTQGSDCSSQFGDIWTHRKEVKTWHRSPLQWEPDGELMAEAVKLAPWWARRDLIVSARLRLNWPTDQNVKDDTAGVLTVMYRLPGQWLGPYLTRSRSMTYGEYRKLTS